MFFLHYFILWVHKAGGSASVFLIKGKACKDDNSTIGGD